MSTVNCGWPDVERGHSTSASIVKCALGKVVIQREKESDDQVLKRPAPVTAQSWFWMLLLGIAMTIGGLITMVVAITRVVLPYDEAMAGITRAEIAAINERLLPFMQHDRVTLAGTMLSVGVLYTALSLTAVRSGQRWARVGILTSGFAGFLSFFLFLGFGYFDALHAFVTAVLLQLLLFALHGEIAVLSHAGNPQPQNEPPLGRADQLGRWIFILHGVLLVTAGIVISALGVTNVFVPEDLWYLEICSEDIAAASPNLIPLIAHDRASFGGMLVACGAVVFISAVWGWRNGNRVLWWTLLIAGLLAYVPTIWIHLAIGYNHLRHLLPAYGGLTLLLVGSILSYNHLVTGYKAAYRLKSNGFRLNATFLSCSR